MARELNKLTASQVKALTTVGRYSDGGGLYLVVAKDGGRKWVFRFKFRGRSTDMGLGAVLSVPLAKARQRAADARAVLADDKNPIEERRAHSAVPTFGEMADRYVTDRASEWRNVKHREQWKATLVRDAASMRPLLVNEVETTDVMKVLTPIWLEKSETASRLRGRIERVLDAAKAKGYRDGDNPARWRGHLDQLLPKRQKLTRGHHPALPFEKVPDFIAALRGRAAVAAMALEFAILTAARSGEVRGTTWSEIDLKARVWTVPATRMKGGREHRVPLSNRAVQILECIAPLSLRYAHAVVFPARSGGVLSDAAFSALLKRMGYATGEATPHGFRSSFRDWAGEVTSYPREIAEAALAHVIGDATERAYRRRDALEIRRALMNEWADFCVSGSASEDLERSG